MLALGYLHIMSDAPGLVVDAALAKLRHLNVGEGLSDISPILKACGGYSDIYTGTLRRKDCHAQVKVAIKRFRIHMAHDPLFAKVRVTPL